MQGGNGNGMMTTRHMMSGSDVVGGQVSSQQYVLGTESRSKGEI